MSISMRRYAPFIERKFIKILRFRAKRYHKMIVPEYIFVYVKREVDFGTNDEYSTRVLFNKRPFRKDMY